MARPLQWQRHMRGRHTFAHAAPFLAAVAPLPFLLACPAEELPPHFRLHVDAAEIPLEGDQIHVVVRIDRAALGVLRWGGITAGSPTASAVAVIPDSPAHVGASTGRAPDTAGAFATAQWLPAIGEDCDAVACEYGLTIVLTEPAPAAMPVVLVSVAAETPAGVRIARATALELLADGGEPILAAVDEVQSP